MDNKSGKVIPGRKKTLMRELSLFTEDEDQPKVSHQLQLAILQYLNTGKSYGNKIINPFQIFEVTSLPLAAFLYKLKDCALAYSVSASMAMIFIFLTFFPEEFLCLYVKLLILT